MQMTCRDRNRLAMQADILGADTLGIKNVLCLTGDHMSFGNHPEAKGVHDLDAINLIKMYKDMRDEKKFQCGEEMAVAPKLYIGCAENPFADPFEFRALRLKKKIEAGADFMQTQCIFNVPKFKKWMEEVRALGLHKEIKILAGITPLKGVGGARYMQKFVPGIDVPQEIVDRMAGIEKGPASHAEGKKIAVEMIKEFSRDRGRRRHPHHGHRVGRAPCPRSWRPPASCRGRRSPRRRAWPPPAHRAPRSAGKSPPAATRTPISATSARSARPGAPWPATRTCTRR